MISFNVRGLQDHHKRKDVFTYLRKFNSDLIFLQETHSVHKCNKIWKQEWGGKAFFANGETNARGVAILVNNKFNGTFNDIIYDINGRYIVCKARVDGNSIAVANIYAPNEDIPAFFREVFAVIESMNCPQIIMGGDFNLVMDSKIDHYGGNTMRKNNTNSLNVITEMMDKLGLHDIWRNKYPDKMTYTWTRSQPSAVLSRLDMFLISTGLVSQTREAGITFGYRSDHSIIKLTLELNPIPKGPGLWKMNTTYLSSDEYQKIIKNTIENAQTKYSNCNPNIKWELTKFEIIRASQKFAKTQSAMRKNKELQLCCVLEYLQDNQCTEDMALTNDIKSELQVLREYKTKGAIF